MPGPLRRVAQEAAGVELVDQVREEILQLAPWWRPRVSLVISVRGGVLVGRRPPFVGHDHDRLRQVQRHEGGVERIADQRVGLRHVVVVEAGALRPEQDARSAGPRAAMARSSAAAPRAVSTGLTMWRGRGQVAKTWCRSATASATVVVHAWPRPGCGRRPTRCARPSPAASRRAARPGAGGTARHWPWRARTAPILSASCGRTRTTTGLLPIGARSAPPSRPVIARRAATRRQVVPFGAVLQHDRPCASQLRPDRVGAGEIARLAGRQPLGDRGLDRGRVVDAAAGTTPPASCCSRPSSAPAARSPAAASASPASAASASACIAAMRQRRVQVVAQRRHAPPAGHPRLRAARRALPARDRSGPARACASARPARMKSSVER